MTDLVEIYTDGACRGNPGLGGWGALLRYKNHEKELYGAEENTTNNRMELLAAIKALEALKRKSHVVLMTDSQYVQKGMTEWLPEWKKKQFKNAQKKPVKNQDLWLRLEQAVEKHQVDWQWIRGHTGHAENERADQLANLAMDEFNQRG